MSRLAAPASVALSPADDDGPDVEVTAADGTVTTYQGRSVIVATGSVASGLPYLPFDEERVLSNVGALSIAEVPKHLIVIGGGVIGLESHEETPNGEVVAQLNLGSRWQPGRLDASTCERDDH